MITTLVKSNTGTSNQSKNKQVVTRVSGDYNLILSAITAKVFPCRIIFLVVGLFFWFASSAGLLHLWMDRRGVGLSQHYSNRGLSL